MPITQSKTLTDFYNAYKAWLNAGAPQGEPFERDYGLCNNLSEYCITHEIEVGVECELQDQFANAGLDEDYPFGEEQYVRDQHNYKMHLNSKRIKWVNDHASID